MEAIMTIRLDGETEELMKSYIRVQTTRTFYRQAKYCAEDYVKKKAKTEWGRNRGRSWQAHYEKRMDHYSDLLENIREQLQFKIVSLGWNMFQEEVGKESKNWRKHNLKHNEHLWGGR